MSSERRIQASRANGAKSKGPKTPEGKARSSQNGVCHGLLANSLVLEEESSDIFTALHAEFVDEFAPSSPFESTLVGLMVAARWRCLRIWGMETSALDREMRNLAAGGAPQSAPEFVDASTRASIAIQSLGGATPSEGLLRRYEAHYERQFARSFHLLVEYRQLSGTIFTTPPIVDLTGPQNSPPPPPPPAPEPEPLAPPTRSAHPSGASNADQAGSPAPAPIAAPTSSSPQPCRRNTRKNRGQRRREAAKQKVRSEPSPKNDQSRLIESNRLKLAI